MWGLRFATRFVALHVIVQRVYFKGHRVLNIGKYGTINPISQFYSMFDFHIYVVVDFH